MTDALSRQAASDAVARAGWRYLLGALCTRVAVTSLRQATQVADGCVRACGADADGHLRVSLRPDHVALSLQTATSAGVTARDVELALGITAAVHDLGLDTDPQAGPGRGVQTLEIAIDAMDIAAIRPFWRAVLAYASEPGHDGPQAALVDPAGLGPAVWFQQMDRPRSQRNRIHFDVTVAHDEADARIAAAVAAGGRLVSDERARAFWILADAEGNEVCICTWQDRD